MATTTNYSWSTPDDVSLVKDGASAIRTLGSSADTTVKALNPGTTAGDIDYYTTSTAKARVGIGTAGQVLRVNSGATAPEWASISTSSMTLLSTTSLTGATTTISSISGDYNSLFGVVTGVTNATASGAFRIAPNGTTNITTQMIGSSTTAESYLLLALGTTNPTSPKLSDANNAFAFEIRNYTSTTAHKPFQAYSYFYSANETYSGQNSGGGIRTTSAITSLVFSNSGGNLSTGTVLLYGVK
jgi:hypothetical protein